MSQTLLWSTDAWFICRRSSEAQRCLRGEPKGQTRTCQKKRVCSDGGKNFQLYKFIFKQCFLFINIECIIKFVCLTKLVFVSVWNAAQRLQLMNNLKCQRARWRLQLQSDPIFFFFFWPWWVNEVSGWFGLLRFTKCSSSHMELQWSSQGMKPFVLINTETGLQLKDSSGMKVNHLKFYFSLSLWLSWRSVLFPNMISSFSMT